MHSAFRLSWIALLLIHLNTSAQLLVTPYDPVTAATMLMGSDVSVFNVTYSGDPIQLGWTNNIASFPTDNGLILSTSDVQNFIPAAFLGDPISPLNEEPDLLTIANSVPPLIGQNFIVNGVFDVAILEFDFIAPGANMDLNFVYGSDEYLTYVNSQYNDVFAILLSGPGLTGPYAAPAGFPNGAANLALVPESNPPLPITISSLNNVLNNNYYIDNPGNIINPNVSLTGYTDLITVNQALTPGATYHLKLAIADGSDSGLKSLMIMNTASFSGSSSSEVCAAIQEEVISICPGESVELNSIPSNYEGLVFDNGIYIPDNQGCLEIDATFTEFESAVIDEITDINNIYFNAEHSFVGDITINLVCPNGSIMNIFPEEGSTGTYLGEPVNLDDGVPGLGYDYSFSPNSTGGTWIDLLANGGIGTIPSGDYEPEGSFADLIGCPLNGTWTLEVCDIVGSDDGYVFEFGVVFSGSSMTNSYSWSTGETTSSIVVNPEETTTYYLYSEANDESCVDSVIVYIEPSVQISSNGPSVVCNGNSVVLTASGAINYQWNTGSTSNELVASNPGTYTVTGFTENCITEQSIVISDPWSQCFDDFTDGDFTNTPLWFGNTNNYIVNSGVLELNDQNGIAGQSALVTSCDVASLSNREWRIWVNQNLTGSAANQTRIYFASLGPALSYAGLGSAGVQGYYLQLGEALSNDVIRLYFDDGVNTVLLASGQTSIAAPFLARLKITVDTANNWTLFSDFTGGENFIEEFSINGILLSSATHFSIINTYTSSNINDFAFDDIYIGPVSLYTEATEFCSGDTITIASSATLVDYYWNNGATGSSIDITTGGNYFVAGTDAFGCDYSSEIITITEFPFDDSITATDDAICDGESVILGVNPENNIVWNNGETTPNLIVTEPGSYFAFVTNGPCNAYTSTIVINEGTTPLVDAFAVDDTLCNDGSTTLLFGTPAGGIWEGPGMDGNTFQSSLAGAGEFVISYVYTNPAGCSGTANETISVEDCSLVYESAANSAFSVYPNPTNNYFLIENHTHQRFTFEIFDMSGKRIQTGTSQENEWISLNLVQSGFYTVRISGEQSVHTYPIIKL